MHGNSVAARNETNDLIARKRIAALSKLDNKIVNFIENNAVFRCIGLWLYKRNDRRLVLSVEFLVLVPETWNYL